MMILIAILTSFLAFAQNCSEINLVTQQNSPFSRMPVLDQAGNGQCYAYVAAQLANYQQIKSGQADSPNVHPAWAAMLYGATTQQRDLRAGVTSHTLDALTNGRNCNEQSVYQAIRARAQLVGTSEAKIMKFIDDYGKIMRDGRYNSSIESERVHALERAADQNNYCKLPQWQRLLGGPELLAQDSVAAMQNLLAQSCSPENQSRLNLPPYQQLTLGDDSAFETRINSALESNNPVGTTFCSWATDKPHSTPPRYVTTNEHRQRVLQEGVTNNACGTHIALIAGRKMIGESCNYLYRNSRGTGWYRDIQHLTCLCKNKQTGVFVDNCRHQTHSARTYTVEACWVPKETLVPNVFDLVHY